jgi:DNA primase (bacterial type)
MSRNNLHIVINKFGSNYFESGNELRYECPKCKSLGKTYHDKKLYVNCSTLFYYCQRCNLKGKLFQEYGVSNKYTVDDLFNKDKKVEEKESHYFEIPKTKLIEYQNSEGYRYMISRGFTDEHFINYDFRIDLDVFRIVVPNKVIFNNFTDMYIARDYIGVSSQKYQNPYDVKKSEIVFNLDKIPNDPNQLIIHEGVLNAIIAGNNSIAIYGKYVSKDQYHMIMRKNPKKIYVSLDDDAIDNAIKFCDKLRKYYKGQVYLVKLPKGKDAVDLGNEGFMKILNKTFEYSSRNIFNKLLTV